MKVIWDNIVRFYVGWLQPTFTTLITFLVNNQYAIYLLLLVLIVLSVVTRKIKVGILPKVIGIVNAVIIILLLIVAYNIFSPSLIKFFKTTPSNNSSTPKKTTPTSSPSTQGTTSEQPTSDSTSTSTTSKQLYYGGGCSGCYADTCPRDGYSYGGYDVNMYNYYRSLCQACQCTSSRWQSLWR